MDYSRFDVSAQEILSNVLQLNTMFKIFDIDAEDLLPDFKISIVEFGKVSRI